MFNFNRSTFNICSWTPSSVCGPAKQAQIVSTTSSICRRPAWLPPPTVDACSPVRWPYAINFWIPSSAMTVSRALLLWQARSKGKKYLSALRRDISDGSGSTEEEETEKLLTETESPPSSWCGGIFDDVDDVSSSVMSCLISASADSQAARSCALWDFFASLQVN